MAASIRPAHVSDASDIARLMDQLGYELTPSDAATRLSRILSRDDQQFVVAEVDGRPVGWVHVLVSDSLETDPFAMIGGLVVERGCRRQGIGRLLMAHAEEWARKRGLPIVRLWSSTTRSPSHRFYERIGYTNIKTQYAFAKLLDAAGEASFGKLVPRVDK